MDGRLGDCKCRITHDCRCAGRKSAATACSGRGLPRIATKNGIVIPTDTATDAILQRVLVRTVAATKWGDEGYYRLSAVTSSEVAAARRAFGRAQSILATR
jgi:hypothetical protein